MIKGLVIKSISGEYTVIDDNENIYICKPRGVFRHMEITPKVGDNVDIDPVNKNIVKIYDRKNDLIRPVMANVDKAFLLFSVREPDLNLNLLDRMISIFEYAGIETIIIFTKNDLLIDAEYEEIKQYYKSIGYKVFDTKKNSELNNKILVEINNNICVFTGQSGVGKSTLLNFFDKDLNIKTDTISYALGRGKHTTRHVELIKIQNGWIADTPGFGIADFDDIDVQTLSQTFVEFFKLNDQCKFRGCTHVNEPGCKVKEKLNNNEILKSRYENYLLFVEEIKQNIKNKY